MTLPPKPAGKRMLAVGKHGLDPLATVDQHRTIVVKHLQGHGTVIPDALQATDEPVKIDSSLPDGEMVVHQATIVVDK